jgi:hypothetical protein
MTWLFRLLISQSMWDSSALPHFWSARLVGVSEHSSSTS